MVPPLTEERRSPWHVADRGNPVPGHRRGRVPWLTPVRGALLLALLGLLSGCASAGNLSAEQSRDRLYAALDGTQLLVGGTWERQDDPTARGCTVPLWTPGITYPALRLGSPPSSIADVVAAVQRSWQANGFEVLESTVGTATEVSARRGGTELLLFRASTAGMTLQGESECRPAG